MKKLAIIFLAAAFALIAPFYSANFAHASTEEPDTLSNVVIGGGGGTGFYCPGGDPYFTYNEAVTIDKRYRTAASVTDWASFVAGYFDGFIGGMLYGTSKGMTSNDAPFATAVKKHTGVLFCYSDYKVINVPPYNTMSVKYYYY